MDGHLLRRFIEATAHVFATMLQSTVTFERPVPTPQCNEAADVSGIIGFSGDVAGAVVIRLPLQTAENVVKSFSGEAFGAESDDFADAIGELANMICGNAKSSLDNGCVNISCPQVVIGKDHKVQRPSDAISVTIPCRSAEGEFRIEISMRQVGKRAPAVAGSARAAG